MTDPYNQKDKLQYWMEKYNQEAERANGLEMDLIHANHTIRELTRKIDELQFKVESAQATERMRAIVDQTIEKIGGRQK